jgi:hypothetical protein
VEGGNKMRRQWTSQERNQGVGIKIRIDGHSGLTVRTSGRYKSSEGYQAAALLSGTATVLFLRWMAISAQLNQVAPPLSHGREASPAGHSVIKCRRNRA